MSAADEAYPLQNSGKSAFAGYAGSMGDAGAKQELEIKQQNALPEPSLTDGLERKGDLEKGGGLEEGGRKTSAGENLSAEGSEGYCANTEPPAKIADQAEVKAPLIEHLTALRRCLVRSLIAFALAFFACFAVKDFILEFLLLPYQWGIKLAGGNVQDMLLQSTSVLETFTVKMKLSAFGAVLIAFPFIAFQMYHFIAPGLYKRERAAFLPFLCAAPLLFCIGAAFVYCLIAPLLLWFSLSQQYLSAGIEIRFIAKISDYLDFMTSFMIIFGCVFQLPVIVTLLVRAGLLQAKQLEAFRKWEILASFIVAAMLTPSDIFSMFGLALPLVLLYEISIILARGIERKQQRTGNLQR